MSGDAYVAIENPMAGKTYYHPDQWGVYRYDTYPEGSVLEGHERRSFLDSFDSEAEARAAYPDAVMAGGSGFADRPLPRFPEDEPDLDRGFGEDGDDAAWGLPASGGSLSFPDVPSPGGPSPARLGRRRPGPAAPGAAPSPLRPAARPRRLPQRQEP